ncbi:MAG: hypothetical protein AB7K86_08440 [Rhodospirillales bacterium]
MPTTETIASTPIPDAILRSLPGVGRADDAVLAEVRSLRREIAELRAVLNPPASPIATGRDVLAQYAALSAGKPEPRP